ncbi:hypothetical protein Tco_1376080 [Tanacetum coccineum]
MKDGDKRQMQTQRDRVTVQDDTAGQDDTNADDTDIRPIYDEEPMAESRIFKSVGLRWIPIGKLFDSCTSKVDSELPHGSNVDIPNIHECKQTLDGDHRVWLLEKSDIQKPMSTWGKDFTDDDNSK